MAEERGNRITQEIDSIVSQIVGKYQPEKIILFGSAALKKPMIWIF